MSAEEEPVERRLLDAGERWRAAQPPPPDPDLGRLAGPATSVRIAGRWAPVAAVAGVLVVLAAVLIPLSLRRAGGDPPVVAAPPTTAAPRVLPPDTGAGVPVEGIGTLLRDGDGPVRLCDEVFATLDMPSSHAGCGRVAVTVTGVDPSRLTSLLTQASTGGQAYSGTVRVEGRYRDGVLAVSRVEETTVEPGPFVEPPVPCGAPEGGWRPGAGFPEQGMEESNAANWLTAYVRARPDRFNDVWEGHPGGVPAGASAPPFQVTVVGTPGDVAQARRELSANYRGNLCVYRVRYAAADLDRIATRLRAVRSTPIQADPDPIANRVRVTVVALDPATVAVLDEVGRDAIRLEEPLLQWLE